MKYILNWGIFLGCTVLALSCRRGNSITISNGKDHVEIRYWGDIKITDDETAIESITPHGYLRYRSNGVRLMAEPDREGGIRYELYDDGEKLDLKEATGRKALAEAVREMIGMGFDAKRRMERIYQRGGYRALLAETDSVKGNYVKGLYFEQLLRADSVSVGEMPQVIKKINGQMDGDYDKGRLLKKVDPRYLDNDSVSKVYLEAVRGIDGDYEKSQVLQYFLQSPLPAERVLPVLSVTKTVDGDYEKANVLKLIINRDFFEGAPFDSLMTLIGQVGGDYERANLLKEVAGRDIREEGTWTALLLTTSRMDADYEKSQVLVTIARKLPRTENLKAAYRTAAKTVNSDDGYRKAMSVMD